MNNTLDKIEIKVKKIFNGMTIDVWLKAGTVFYAKNKNDYYEDNFYKITSASDLLQRIRSVNLIYKDFYLGNIDFVEKKDKDNPKVSIYLIKDQDNAYGFIVLKE